MRMILGSILLAAMPAFAQCPFIGQLTPYQESVAKMLYSVGQPYDLGNTAIAVGWQESKLGLYKLRMGKGKDISVGIGHTIVYYKTKTMDAFHRGMWMQDMIQNDRLSSDVMIQDLLYWKSHTDSWRQMVADYNGGWKGNMKYAASVAAITVEVSQCKWSGND